MFNAENKEKHVYEFSMRGVCD